MPLSQYTNLFDTYPFSLTRSHTSADGEKSIYGTLSRSMRTELLVRSRQEDPAVQKERAQAVKAKSVSELSQIKSFDDIPVPSTLENWVGRGSRPVERRKRFREKYVKENIFFELRIRVMI